MRNGGRLPFRFYKTPSPHEVLWTVVVLAGVAVGAFLLHRLFVWYHARREQSAFFHRVAERRVPAEQEDTLVDLVNHNLDILGRPTEIFRSLRVFDRVASAEIGRLLAGERPEEEKQAEMDRIYALRGQMFPAGALGATGGRGEE